MDFCLVQAVSICCFSGGLSSFLKSGCIPEEENLEDPAPLLECQMVVHAGEEEAEDGNMLGYQLVVDPQSDHEEGDDMEEEDEENRPKKRGGQSVRVRLPVYKKLQCIRELDRLIESGQRKGLEKSVMHSFPEVFMGTRGKMKTGMLGRWLVQADEQSWRKIPFEKMSAKDQQMKDLPDWVRLPLGMTPRSLDRFKSGTNVPQPVVTKVVQMIERVTCGQGPALTAGVLKAESVKKEVESMLQVFNDAQKKTAEENGIAIPDQKSKVSIRWVNRLLSHYGWKRNAPNTYGAYLEFDDERMVRSRRAWRFLRPRCPNMHVCICFCLTNG